MFIHHIYIQRSWSVSGLMWGYIVPGVMAIIIAVLFVPDIFSAFIALIVVGSLQILNGLSLFGQRYLSFDREKDRIYLIQTGFFGIMYQSKLLGVYSHFETFHYTEGTECGCMSTTKVIIKFTGGVDQQIDSGNREKLLTIYDPIQQSVGQIQSLV